MKFPKLLDGPNPVGEAKARHLETIDAPFLTAIGPGFVASKKGPTSEVTGVVESKQVVEDGWFSFTEPDAGNVIVRGSSAPNVPFRKRGTFGNSFSSSPLFASGSGWGYFREFIANDDPAVGYTSFRYLKSRNGRKGSELFRSSYLSSTIESSMALGGSVYAGASTEAAMYDGAYSIVVFGADKKTDADGVVRQIGIIRLFSETSPGVWTEYLLPSPIAADTESYTIASGCILKPGTIAVSIAKFGDILPKVYITDDYGASWTACPALPDIYPDQGAGWPAVKTRAQLAIDFPADTAQQIEARFVDQTTVKMRAYGTELEMYAIADDRILIDAIYLQANAGNLQWQSLSVIDPYTGDLKWQKHNLNGNTATPLKFYDAKPTGFGAWIYFLVDDDGVTFLESKVITEFSSVETDILLPAGFVSFDAPFYHRKETNEINLDPPRLYFMASDGVSSYLAVTKDYFDTAKVTAKVGEYVLSYADFSEVVWIGSKDNRAPIDPTFPWRTDSRVSMPDWWINVSAYGG